MNIESFNFSVEGYSTELTCQSHKTLYWLHQNGYLNDEQTIDLLERMVVVPIRNNKKFGSYILERFFNKKSSDNSFVFPITLLDEKSDFDSGDKTTPEKPQLRIVGKGFNRE